MIDGCMQNELHARGMKEWQDRIVKATLGIKADVALATLPMGDTRPSWGEYFLRIAKDVSERSNCCRRKVGAVIVKDNHIISTGYNGTPAGTTNCFDGGCPRCNHTHTTGEKLDECLCVHAEQNAICQAAKHGNSVDGGHIYITCSPCLTCLKLIINAGITRIVFSEWYKKFNEQEINLIKEAGLVVIPPKEEGGL
jgi:dCMP deaminase